MIVVAQAGHINSGAFDDLAAIAAIARDHNAWLHVDGAFGLWANAAPALAHLCSSARQGDSWAVDGHKWLQAPYDTGFAIVKHPAAHRRAMAVTASYLNQAPGSGRDPSALVPELSRRARGFAVWALLQSLGREGVAEMLTRHCRCARELRQLLLGEAGITVINRVELNQLAVVFGVDGETQAQRDKHAEAVIETLQRQNSVYVSGASWRGQWIMRVSIISRTTDTEHIASLAHAIVDAWQAWQGRTSVTT
jgi:glutamate/tyrosine decarboxylase-like PLP-dependent enzyme